MADEQVDTSKWTIPDNYKQKVAPILQDSSRKGSAPVDPSVAPEFAGQMLPVLGSFAGPEGTIAGSLAKQALQGYFPKTFGEGPQSGTEALGNTALDLGANELAPRIASKLLSPVKSISEALSSKLGQKFSAVKDAINLDKAAEFSNLPVTSGAQVPSAAATQRLMSKGFSESAQTLDPDAILKELDKNSSDYSDIDPDTRKRVVDFLQGAQKTSSNDPFYWNKKHLLMNLGPALVGAETGHTALGAAASAGVIFTPAMVSKLMSNPDVGPLVVKMAKGELPPESQSFAKKVILTSLKGATAYARTGDGEKEKVEIGPQGEVRYPSPTQ